MTVLLLPPPPPDQDAQMEPKPMSSMVSKEFEASGRSFETFYYSILGLETTGESEATGKGERKAKQRRTEQRKKGVKSAKLTEAELEADHYEVLDLKKLEWNATEDQIKAAYRKLVVETHPDKTKSGDDTQFKAVQKAYEVLSDPQKRLAYDSSIPFDDDIPSLRVSADDFFEVFGDAFHRNSRWSTSRNVPLLGDWSTPIEKVEEFYEFWSTFKSWRDFTHDDMHNTEEADSREERRWMERENERERTILQRQERKRIKDLVERSRTLDPRLKKHKEEQARIKEEQRRAIEEKKQKKIEDQLRREEEAKLEEQRLQKLEAAKKRAEAAKRKTELAALRTACVGCLKPFTSPQVTRDLSPDFVSKPDADWFFSKSTTEGLQAFKAALETVASGKGCEFPNLSAECSAETVEIFNEHLKETEIRVGIDRFGYPIRKAKVDSAKKEKTKTESPTEVWTEQELVDLAKAIAKYPGGSFSRWENISTYIGTKTPDQVLRRTKIMTHQMHEGQAPTKPEALKQGDAKVVSEKPVEAGPTALEDWTKAQQKQLEDALKVLKDYKEKDKWDKVAALVEGKNKKQCVERYKYLASLFKKPAQ